MRFNREINETLLFENENSYNTMKKINITFAIIVSTYPAILNISNKLIPNLLVDIFCAIFIFLPYIVQRKYEIIILEEFKFLITFHSMLHTVFGKVYHFYDKYPIYDDILHILGGGLIASIVFSIITSIELHYSKHSKYAIRVKSSLFTLGITNIAGVGWEILEFFGDIMFRHIPGYRIAQEDSLFDTMTDLIENNIGAILAIIVFRKFLRRNENKNRSLKKLFKKLIPDPSTLKEISTH